MKKTVWVLAALAAVLTATAFAADEYSMRFWVKVPTLPATVQPAETFKLEIAADGSSKLTLFGDRLSGSKDFEMSVTPPVKTNVWHHFAVRYSRALGATCYLDRLPMFNYKGVLPPLDERGVYVKESPGVDVKEFSSHPEYLEADYLVMATDGQLKFARERAQKLAKTKKAKGYAAYFDYFIKTNAKTPYNVFPAYRIAETLRLIEDANRIGDFDPKKFRLACYNLHMCEGAEDWNQPFREGELRGAPRVARTLDEINADIVCVQEIHQRHDWTGHVDQPAYLAAQCNYDSSVFTNGLAQFARTKPESVRAAKVNGSTLLVCDYGSCIIATTHYNVNVKLAKVSAEETLKELANPSKPVIFCGDLNLLPDSEGIAVLKKGFTMLSDPSQFTCHALHPDICLDYFFVDTAHAGQVKASGYTVGTGSSQASDHCPIWIDLEIR